MPEEFRSITAKDWENVDEGTRKNLTSVIHMGILRSSETHIYNEMKAAIEGGHRQEDLVAVCMHVDEILMPPEMRAGCMRSNLEVSVFIAQRQDFAQKIQEFEIEKHMKKGKKRYEKIVHPYEKASRALMTPPPEKHVYMVVFAKGACTVTCFGFDVEKSAPLPVQEARPMQLPTP